MLITWTNAEESIKRSVAALGDDVRQYPEIAPTALLGREWTGVAVMRLPDPLRGFLLSFSYPSGALDRVFVHLNGCGRLAATNGSRSGQIDEKLVSFLVSSLGYPIVPSGPVGIPVPGGSSDR